MSENLIQVIHPYWDEGDLVFDDDSVGLRREPFVCGTDDALGILAAAIPGCEKRFTLLFSHVAFPTHQLVADRCEAEAGGYWYEWKAIDVRGWLCPALFKYFKSAPEKLYVEIKSPTRGANENVTE